MFGVWKPWVWTAWIRVCCLIPSIFAYIYPPKLPSVVGKKDQPHGGPSGILTKKMNQKLCSALFQDCFPSFQKYGHFMPFWCDVNPPLMDLKILLVGTPSLPFISKMDARSWRQEQYASMIVPWYCRCIKKTRWWQLKYFLFSTLIGEMIQFD